MYRDIPLSRKEMIFLINICHEAGNEKLRDKLVEVYERDLKNGPIETEEPVSEFRVIEPE